MNINQISQTSSFSGTSIDLAQGLNSPQSCIDPFTVQPKTSFIAGQGRVTFGLHLRCTL